MLGSSIEKQILQLVIHLMLIKLFFNKKKKHANEWRRKIIQFSID